MKSGARGVSAAFDAIVMVAVAFATTGGSLAHRHADVVIWGSAAAAIVAAVVVLTSAPPVLGWMAIGYILFAAFLDAVRPIPLLALLALAYMPVVPRPRGSLLGGLSASLVTAGVLGIAARALAT